LFCSQRCIEGARPARKGYFRRYMKKRRTSLKRLTPELADKVKIGEMSLREGLREVGRKVTH